MILGRKDKIRLLSEIKAGRLSIEVLNPCRVYYFFEEGPGIYRKEGELFSQKEFDEFCEQIRQNNAMVLTWLQQRKPDVIITFVRDYECEPIQEH